MVKRLVLPQLAVLPTTLIDLVGGIRLPAMENIAELGGLREKHKDVDMIRHYDPMVEAVPLSIEVLQSVCDNGGAVGAGKLTIADVIVKPALDTVTEEAQIFPC
jgi:hypothetical protein